MKVFCSTSSFKAYWAHPVTAAVTLRECQFDNISDTSIPKHVCPAGGEAYETTVPSSHHMNGRRVYRTSDSSREGAFRIPWLRRTWRRPWLSDLPAITCQRGGEISGVSITAGRTQKLEHRAVWVDWNNGSRRRWKTLINVAMDRSVHYRYAVAHGFVSATGHRSLYVH